MQMKQFFSINSHQTKRLTPNEHFVLTKMFHNTLTISTLLQYVWRKKTDGYHRQASQTSRLKKLDLIGVHCHANKNALMTLDIFTKEMFECVRKLLISALHEDK
ncbi:hypothetical protein RF11_01726 [Thelohanellus kitauei]|uniref:Uncharacterized protein n=1 Tax=Thelohanellus kitauei TaxID=669202 RepID=A0A0C2M9P7_THEKT|nr:hypothetical protein RF11_01726 [Thelohanellus kitauei]